MAPKPVIEESQTLFDEIEFTEGLTIDRGYVSPYLVKDQERQISELTGPRILVTDAKIDNVNEIVPILEQLVKIFTIKLVLNNSIFPGSPLGPGTVESLPASSLRPWNC